MENGVGSEGLITIIWEGGSVGGLRVGESGSVGGLRVRESGSVGGLRDGASECGKASEVGGVGLEFSA